MELKEWKRFVEEIAGHAQVFVVGPMLNTRSFIPAGPTIYVDGGCQFRPMGGGNGKIPSVSVGDGDSTTTELEVVLPKQKDYSDLAFVLHMLPPHIRHVELQGFLGGRRDHELIGFGEVNKFLSPKKDFTTVRFDESVVAFAGGSLKISITTTFSLVVLEEAFIRVMGACEYALNTPTKISPASSIGLSNVGHGSVIIDCNKPCFLFLN